MHAAVPRGVAGRRDRAADDDRALELAASERLARERTAIHMLGVDLEEVADLRRHLRRDPPLGHVDAVRRDLELIYYYIINIPIISIIKVFKFKYILYI